MAAHGIITLTTDFGTADPYVGVMKGVMLSLNPSLRFIDLTHQIPPQDIPTASFQLSHSLRYFPAGTVHLAVIDPGVGSDRQAIALEIPPTSPSLSGIYSGIYSGTSSGTSSGTHSGTSWLVGPNNGIFSAVLAQHPPQRAILLDNPDHWRIPNPSHTFHGRDIFAPAAAHLASGGAPEKLGRSLPRSALQHWLLPGCEIHPDQIVGTIQHIDGFGNLISNIPNDRVNKNWSQPLGWTIKIGDRQILATETYSDASIGEPVALRGSHGWIEIAINGGNAQTTLGASLGDKLSLRPA